MALCRGGIIGSGRRRLLCPRHSLVFAFFSVSVLAAFLCALFLGAEEAQAKGGGNGGPRGGEAGKQAEGAPGGAGQQAGGALDGATKKAEGALGRATEPAGGGGNTAPTTSTPRVDDEAASLHAGPVRQAVTEQTQRPATATLKKPGGGTLEAATEPVETAGEAAAPTLGRAKETLGKATEPLSEASESLVEGVAPTGEATSRPVVEKANWTTGPVLGEATQTVELVEQVGETTSPVVKQVGETAGPVLKTAAPIREAVDPVLQGTTSLVEPVVGKAAPILGAATPAVEPVLGKEATPVPGSTPFQGATPSLTEPYLGAGTPVMGPALGATGTSPRAAFERVAPAFEPLFGTGYDGPKGAALNVFAADAEISASPSATIPSSVLDARTAPGAARGAVEEAASAPHRSEAVGDSRPSTTMAAAPSSGSHPSRRSFDGPLDGRYPAAIGSALAKIAQNNEAPGPLGPSGFPYAAPAAGGSFGGSGVGLELLGALALLSLLWRVRGLWLPPPESLRLRSIASPVPELPG